MLPAEYLDDLRRDSDALSAAARRAPDAQVPTCPEWDTAALVGHVGGVHRWVAGMVESRAAERAQFPAPPAGSDIDGLLDWFDEGAGNLLSALETVDPDDAVWNWSARRPAPASFWHRRMAHETAVHRWDAENASGVADPIRAGLAADGVDEYLGFVAGRLSRAPVEGLEGSLRLEASDVGALWAVTLAPDALKLETHEDGAASSDADASVQADASDLLLWLTSRVSSSSPLITVGGDPRLVTVWEESVHF
jgi:uncharacterized protein (TIGR03083 family)